MRKKRGKSGNVFNSILILLYLITGAVILYYFINGLDYYLTPLPERPHHNLYFSLKPGGVRSHGFGVIGSLFLISLLTYSLRKRTRLFGERGMMSRWLRIHIFMGITGPLFIILHSTLKLNGLVAVSFWSMIAVALSGILGRYIYLQIPRNFVGAELSKKDMDKLSAEMDEQLKSDFNLDKNQYRNLEDKLVSPVSAELSLRKTFAILSFDYISRPWRKYKLLSTLQSQYKLPKKQARDLLDLTQKKAILERRMILLNRMHELFHYWHVFHKPFAVIMYIIMLVHIGVSVWLGYNWIF